MSVSSKHLTPERLKIIGETAPAVAEKVIDGTIPNRFYEKMLGENPELRAFFNMSHGLPQSRQGNRVPRSAATSMCNSLGRLSVSSRCPTSFQGGVTPSPKESTSSACIVRPSVAVRQHRRGQYHVVRNSDDSTWNVEEPINLNPTLT